MFLVIKTSTVCSGLEKELSHAKKELELMAKRESQVGSLAVLYI
jgi:hypothetical protein